MLDAGFQLTHTLRNVAAALTLEGDLDTYLYASSYAPRDLRVSEGSDVARMEPVLLPLLGTGQMMFLSAGAGLTRFEKTQLIAGSASAQALLDVCINSARQRQMYRTLNCSRCWKCARTMVSLDLLGKLNEFGALFDVPRYRAHRQASLDQVGMHAVSGSSNDIALVVLGKAAGLPFRSRPVLRVNARLIQARRRLRAARSSAGH